MRAVAVLAALACAVGVGGPGMAAAGAGGWAMAGAGWGAVSGGKIRIFADASTEGAVSKILFTGAIGDYGTATSMDKNGKVDTNGNYVKMALKKGTFEVDSTALNAKLNKAPGTFNKST